MTRLFVTIALLGVIAVALALLAPSLPDGNPIREVGEAIREFGGSIGRGFGGGYGELPANP